MVRLGKFLFFPCNSETIKSIPFLKFNQALIGEISCRSLQGGGLIIFYFSGKFITRAKLYCKIYQPNTAGSKNFGNF